MPQGTLETGLGLPVSLNVQFTDGAAGEVAVAWQCAAGYDPNAEAGTQFAFAAVLPEGYAPAEGVSLPEILVTLTPPLANAMLMAATSGEGWTLSDDGTLTVTDSGVAAPDIPALQNGSVKRIEVAEGVDFYLISSFSGGITVKAGGSLTNSGNVTLSGDITLQGGRLDNVGTVTGSVTVKAGGELYNNSVGTLSCNVTVETGGSFDNYGTITGGTFKGKITGGTFKSYVENYFVGAAISGGVFTDASVNNDGGSITGGVFRSFTMDSQSKELTITGVVDLDKDFALAPLTIALDGESIKSITVAEDAAFDAGSGVSVPVTNNAGGEINGGDFRDATVIDNGGTFDNFTMDSGKGALTITGAVDLDVEDALDPLTIGLEAVKEITVEKIATFDAGENTISAAITNDGAITGGTIDGEIRANTGTIKGCAFGPNATVISNEGIIELSITVDERDRKVNYGADVLDALGMSPTGLWYRENADGTRSPVKEGETFASLQTAEH